VQAADPARRPPVTEVREADWPASEQERHTRCEKASTVLTGDSRVTGKASSSEPCEVETAKDRPSRVTWEIERRGDTCKLTLIHDDFDGETATYKSVGPGWNPVLSGLKTLLETGKPLVIAPPAA
jgi:hypothetical protein